MKGEKMKIEKNINIGKRAEQQDNLGYFQDENKSFLVVADGMGGHKGGEMASSTLLEESEKLFKEYSNKRIDDVEDFFQTIVTHTSESLAKKVEAHEGYIDPHTTVAFALIQDGKVFVGNIGDSRVYIFNEGHFVKRSKDHSVVEYLFDIGKIKEEEMATHPDQNKLLRSINAKEASEISFFEVELGVNFAVLVCSDGFWEGVSKETMQKKLFLEIELKKSLEKMVDIALKSGGKKCDNISVVACVKLEEGFKIKRNQSFMEFLNELGAKVRNVFG